MHRSRLAVALVSLALPSFAFAQSAPEVTAKPAPKAAPGAAIAPDVKLPPNVPGTSQPVRFAASPTEQIERLINTMRQRLDLSDAQNQQLDTLWEKHKVLVDPMRDEVVTKAAEVKAAQSANDAAALDVKRAELKAVRQKATAAVLGFENEAIALMTEEQAKTYEGLRRVMLGGGAGGMRRNRNPGAAPAPAPAPATPPTVSSQG